MAVQVPVLRKDFLVHPSQLIESRAAGADAVLLIAAAVSPLELDALLATARDLGLGVLLEAHSEADLGRGARDRRGGDRGERPRPGDARGRCRPAPAGSSLVSRRTASAVLESGIATREDVVAAVEAGASAILVGEALMRADDPRALLRGLLGEESHR